MNFLAKAVSRNNRRASIHVRAPLPIHSASTTLRHFTASPTNNTTTTDITSLNRTTVRLYRLLLRECDLLTKSVVGSGGISGGGNASSSSSGVGAVPNNSQILLQPKLDPRDYGKARLVSTTTTQRVAAQEGGGRGGVIGEEQKEEVEVVCRSIWNFWIRTMDDEGGATTKLLDRIESLQRRDDDDDETNSYDDIWDDNDSDDEYEEEEKDHSLMVSPQYVKETVRRSFLRLSPSSSEQQRLDDNFEWTKKELVQLQRSAIDALKIIDEQRHMFDRTCVTVDWERGVRVVATSRCIGSTATSTVTSAQSSTTKHRFAYRIRVENINSTSSDQAQSSNADDGDDSRPSSSSHLVQLLGRTWKIQEEPNTIDGQEEGDVVTVKAPTTGAVGHLPVIRPGQAFEYMSGCELEGPKGTMGGCFHMAIVDEGTESAMVGDPVTTFQLDDRDRLFEMPVGPFPLIAD